MCAGPAQDQLAKVGEVDQALPAHIPPISQHGGVDDYDDLDVIVMVVVMMTIASLQFRWVCRRPPALSGSNPDAAWPCVGPDQTILIMIMMIKIRS